MNAHCLKTISSTVMADFMCQLDGAMRFGQCYSRCMSVRVVWGEMNICIGRLSKADCAPQCGWASSYQKVPIEQKADPFSE